jgi:hypothetical protein
MCTGTHFSPVAGMLEYAWSLGRQMGVIARVLAAFVVIAIIVYAVRTTAPPNSPASFAASPPSAPAFKTVPDGPSIPHAFTVLPSGYDKSPAEKLAAADAMIARWKKWKAKPLPEVIPFADYRNARMNLTTIKETDPEYQAALHRAAELDAFGIALAKRRSRSQRRSGWRSGSKPSKPS